MPEANRTRHPLRIRLLTADDRLYRLPWGKIEYEGRHLVADGWTVECHDAVLGGFPEFPSHICSFPGKVVLAGVGKDTKVPHATTHFQDLQGFFQRSWPQTPQPTWCCTAAELREALSTGSTRLVYYFGIASFFSRARLDVATASRRRGHGRALDPHIAEWCRKILAEDVLNSTNAANIRVISILAMETETPEVTRALEARILDAIDDLNDAEVFHLGELGPLAGVRRPDLQNYFRDQQICSCDDRYRDEFPRLLLGPQRREMPFDEAVTTIRRGDPDNWGNLFETLSDMTEAGTWPPAAYAPGFWEHRNAGA